METRWTEEQSKVLGVRNKNVLVSAAAGSGKTAVLVERIIRLVTEENVDVDNLVVVTFTESAAGEMRERILKAIEKRSREEPDNEHIQKQISYIHNARITTMHSFCLDIVRQYFNEIDLDPAFTVGDEGELTLIREDVMKELLEDKYREGDNDFLDFADDYSSSGSKSDKAIEELILKLYKFSMSYPYPKSWLDENISNYDTSGGIEDKAWYIFIMEETDQMLKEISDELKEAIELASAEDGPYTYEEGLREDYKAFMGIVAEKDYDRRGSLLSEYKFISLPRKRLPDTVDEKKKERIKAIRKSIQDDLKILNKKYYAYSMKTVISDMEKCKKQINVLVELTKEFMDRFENAKLSKNIIDFNDMEHYALDILTKRDDAGNVVPTQAARDIAGDIYEVMIDEYQDSNLVQETIIRAVSGAYEGRNNIFMVGDVKQSIYKFRLAKPELFLEKYNRYSTDDTGDEIRITLSKNFRSRSQIIGGTNLLFRQIMSGKIGGIEYDSENFLYTGARYDEYGADTSVEVLALDTKTAEEDNEDIADKELEAYMVAKRIKELMKDYMVRDKETGERRQVRYSDIAVLLRSFGSYGQIYADILAKEGIPVKSPTASGYFDTFEVTQVLNMLSVIDNPRQDIPLAAVLKHMYGFNDEELAKIRMEAGESAKSFYDCVRTGEITRDFINDLDRYREMAPYTSIRDLIEDILKNTGFGYFVSAMKSGDLRRANLEMLKSKAEAYENTSYTGLFNFVRYIKLLKKYNVEQGEADTLGGGNYVTLMTIHKSKGLEYPIVFVGAMCKKFNKMDLSGPIVMSQELGVGIRYIDKSTGIKAGTLIKESIGRKLDKENIGEELRIFYVAMTRAKEKLILAGHGSIYGKINKYLYIRNLKQEKLMPSAVFKAADYMDWVIMSLMRHKSFSSVLKDMGEAVPFNSDIFEAEADFTVNIQMPKDIMPDRVEEAVEKNNEKQVYLNWNENHIYDDNIRKKIESLYSYVYPNEADLGLSGKISVSDIKHMFMEMYDEQTEPDERISGFETDEKPVPIFVSGDKKMSGTLRGTAYHRIFELLDYTALCSIDDREKMNTEIKAQLESLKNEHLAPEEYFNAIDINKIYGLVTSDIGKRMMNAAKADKLYREKQFVMGIPANMVKDIYSAEERVLVQGIVDAYFEEDNELVIVDYKTDNVANINDLRARYETQLEYYSRALEQITGMRVKERVLYSVKFNRELGV